MTQTNIHTHTQRLQNTSISILAEMHLLVLLGDLAKEGVQRVTYRASLLVCIFFSAKLCQCAQLSQYTQLDESLEFSYDNDRQIAQLIVTRKQQIHCKSKLSLSFLLTMTRAP